MLLNAADASLGDQEQLRKNKTTVALSSSEELCMRRRAGGRFDVSRADAESTGRAFS